MLGLVLTWTVMLIRRKFLQLCESKSEEMLLAPIDTFNVDVFMSHN